MLPHLKFSYPNLFVCLGKKGFRVPVSMECRIKIPIKTGSRSSIRVFVIIQDKLPYSGEADEDQRKVLKGMTEVAKEKETGALNESAESIKVRLLCCID
jgi:hypothetical protein